MGCWTNSLPQKYRPDLGKPDGPVFTSLDAGPALSVFIHEDIEGSFQMISRLASLVLLPSTNI
jgi:hypothetical protein